MVCDLKLHQVTRQDYGSSQDLMDLSPWCSQLLLTSSLCGLQNKTQSVGSKQSCMVSLASIVDLFKVLVETGCLWNAGAYWGGEDTRQGSVEASHSTYWWKVGRTEEVTANASCYRCLVSHAAVTSADGGMKTPISKLVFCMSPVVNSTGSVSTHLGAETCSQCSTSIYSADL